jgi:hypothetical protein
MREAEMADLKKQVDDVSQDIKQYDPLKDVRADVEAIGKDLDAAPDKNLEEKSSEKEMSKETAPESPAAAAPAKELPIPEAAAELRDKEIVGAGVGPVAPEAAAEASSPDGAGRTR